MNRFLSTDSKDPYYNLALEAALFSTQESGAALYLWQNENTVVIGRNQCAMLECDMPALKALGVRLARRPSGGGAVFHDIGNLNFTFVVNKSEYDVKRQLGVIVSAVASLGINASLSGRNDVVDDQGRKFSGNAFLHSDSVSLHHGTILVCADMTRLSQVLSPPKEKLMAHAVKSVRSRVINLCDINPSITIAAVKDALERAFINEYGAADDVDEEALTATADFSRELERFQSFQWRIGKTRSFDVTFTEKFDSFMLTADFTVKNGIVADAMLYSDAMEDSFCDTLKDALVGVKFERDEIANAVCNISPHGEAVAEYFRRKL